MNKSIPKPILSVIIPLYNNESFIGACVQSVIDQNFDCNSPVEIIVVDDGSTDNSVNVVRRMMKKYKNIKLISQDNHGVSSARNRGIDVAMGKYVYFLDSDDTLIPDCFPTFIIELERTKADILHFLSSSDIHEKTLNPSFRVISPALASTDVIWLYIIKREYIISNKLRFDERLCIGEDNLFIVKMLYSAKPHIIKANDVAHNYRINIKGITHSEDEAMSSRRIKQYYPLIVSWIETIDNVDIPEERLNLFKKSIRTFSYRYIESVYYNVISVDINQIWNNITYLKRHGLFPIKMRENRLLSDCIDGFFKKSRVLFVFGSLLHKIINKLCQK